MKFKVFSDHFSSFIILTYFPTWLTFIDFLDSSINFASKIKKSFAHWPQLNSIFVKQNKRGGGNIFYPMFPTFSMFFKAFYKKVLFKDKVSDHLPPCFPSILSYFSTLLIFFTFSEFMNCV